VWDGARWRRDELNSVQELTRAVSVVRWDEVAAMGNPEEGESKSKRARWALATESKRGRDNMLALAQSVPGISVSHEALDGDAWLLNVANGTLDLRTGVLREHARADHLTKLSPVAYDASAACPTWDRFLERVTGGNVELANFLARAVGYSLTGDVGEQVVFFLQGAGANGKSTFTKILRELLGDYGTQAAPDLLLAKHGEAHPTEIADLHGARFALCQEVEQGRAWAEATLKQITGGDRVKARRMRENFWEFEPTHKLWVCANHRPRVRGADEGIWRRIKLVPFAVTIPEGERDRTLLEKLRAELPGILAWAVRGCLAWQRDGLGVPEEIREATAAYRLAEDQIESFIEDACETGPGFEAPKTPLYEAFRRWLLASGEPIIDAKEFRARMLAKGFAENRTKSARVWCGVRVRDSAARFGMATG
jgi:putative DNA primase/helicase